MLEESTFLNGVKIWVLHRILRADPFHVIINKHFLKKVHRIGGAEMFIFVVDEGVPSLPFVPTEVLIIFGIQLKIVLHEEGFKILGSHDFVYLFELVVVVEALEDVFHPEHYFGEHDPGAPDIK